MAEDVSLVCGVDSEPFRRVMGRFATGVAIITTRDETGDHGMTVNSLTSVSLEPPLLLCCLSRDSRTAAAVQNAGSFVINILARDQMALAKRFARNGGDHFEGVRVARDLGGLPVLSGAIGSLVCSVTDLHPGGDHVIVMGLVESCSARDGEPLIFSQGGYVRQRGDDGFCPAPSWWA